MTTSATLLAWTKDRFEEIGRVRVWTVLRTMDGGLLERAGISPELLEKGPDAWPWRAGNDENWSSADRLSTGASVGERGVPVPIEATARLDAGESPQRRRRGGVRVASAGRTGTGR